MKRTVKNETQRRIREHDARLESKLAEDKEISHATHNAIEIDEKN
jgi:hypothetical protein